MESNIKPIIERLINRDSITAQDYIDVLDWLDKVRIGLWLAYHLLQKNPIDIEPTFHIDSRLGIKDRLVAVYPIESDNIGLNAFGVESLVFHKTPSCFGLRVNNLLLLNMSADYLFSARCGFPFPRERKLLLDGQGEGMLQLAKFEFRGKVRHPIMRAHFHKPSVLIYQPIMQVPWSTLNQGTVTHGVPSNDSFLIDHTIPPHPSDRGVVFQQHRDRVEVIRDPSHQIEFESVLGIDCKPMSQLVAQVYDFQNYIQDLYEPSAAKLENLVSFQKAAKQFKKHNTAVSNFLKRQNVANV